MFDEFDEALTVLAVVSLIQHCAGVPGVGPEEMDELG
jgi:hypothetical protein